jgi:hypothetical protein
VRRANAVLLAVCALGSLLWASAARAADTPERLFREGVAALQRGAHDEAIGNFELLADRGFVHPDASFNRGAAYVQRAGTSAAEPGDLGRAAAALNEVLLLRPDDDAAESALERVRAEIARRRARQGASALMVQKKLSRAAVELFSEDTWAFGALAGSFFLTLGLAALRVAEKPALRLTAVTTASLAALVLFTCGGLTAAARHFRVSSEPAVVVTSEARLLDATGSPITSERASNAVVALPEGAQVDIVERRGTLVRVEWGASGGFVTQGQLRVLQTAR